MAIVIDKKQIQNNVARLKNKPKETVLKDYVSGEITIKNVPFIKNESSDAEPYSVSGPTLERVLQLLMENRVSGRNEKQIDFCESIQR